MRLGRDGTEIEESVPDPSPSLPLIIDATGWYVTRAGEQAYVDAIRDPRKATANCTGYIYKTIPWGEGTKAITEFNTWQANGRWKFLGECPRDIVSKV